MNVDVEVDVADASLNRTMGATLMPAAIARAGVFDIGKPEAPPLRQPAAAFPAELPRQYGFLAILVGTDDVGTHFAGATTIGANHLLPREDRIAEKGVGRTWHRGVFADKLRLGP